MSAEKETYERSAVSRRGFLQGALAAVAVVGFDSELRSWVTAEELAGGLQGWSWD